MMLGALKPQPDRRLSVLHPTRSLARDPRKQSTRMTDEPRSDYPSIPVQMPGAGWSPEPWVENGAVEPLGALQPVDSSH